MASPEVGLGASVATGSVLLGQELRRLRGTRTLEEVVAISKAPPLLGSVPPLSSSSLSDIECGLQMPRLTTLFALSLVYQVSMNQLMGYWMEESLAKSPMAARDLAEGDAAATFARLLSVAEWHRALPLAIHCERQATREVERIAWRANRASCLAHVGLHAEAVTLLTECLENSALSPRAEFRALQVLADTHAAAGHYKAAASRVRDAAERVPEDASASERANLEALRASLILDVQEGAAKVDERAAREAIRLLELAERVLGMDDPTFGLRLRCMRARAYRLLGNRAVASRDLESILHEAAELRYARIEGRAAFELARLRREGGDPSAARSLLERSMELGEAAQQMDLVFESCFALFELLRDERPGAAVVHYRRCREIMSLLPGVLPSVQRFRKIVKEING